MELGNVLTVRQAADRLGLPPQRIRELLVAGELAGERVGPIWMVSTTEVVRFGKENRPVGRPFGERLAWAVLALATPALESPRLAGEERRRAAHHAQRPFDELAPRLRRRATLRHLSAAPRLLESALSDPRCVAGSDRRPQGQPLDIYLRTDDLEAFEDEMFAVPDRRFPNLVLHVVKPKNWPFGSPEAGRSIPGPVAALDLVERDAREKQIAADLWNQSLQQTATR